MAPKENFDFKELFEQAKELIYAGKANNTRDLARLLHIDRRTLMDGFERNFNVRNFKQITGGGKVSLMGDEQQDRLEVDIEGNFGTIRSVTVVNQIKTIDELLKVAGVSRGDYEVINPRIKKWDVALKLKVDKDHEAIQVVPSIYLEAPLRSKHPKAFEPVIQPIQIDLPKLPKPNKTKKGTVRRALIVNDPQIGFRRTLHTTELHPFHDRRVLDLALQIAQTEKIDHISFGGDCLDLSEWSSKFLPEPEFYWTTQPALLEWAWWLLQFRLAQPTAEIKTLEGNHDIRMPLLISGNLRQAYQLRAADELTLPPALSVPKLLALHKLDIEYVSGYPDNGYWLNKNILITHGDMVRGTPGATAAALTQRQAFTTIFGHIHRREHVARRMKTFEGDLIYSAFCPGAACHIDGRVPGSKSTDQWQQGIAVIEYTEDAENIIPIAIQDGHMIYNGQEWQARLRETEIEKFLTGSLKEKHV